jgi:hypothetical protein
VRSRLKKMARKDNARHGAGGRSLPKFDRRMTNGAAVACNMHHASCMTRMESLARLKILRPLRLKVGVATVKGLSELLAMPNTVRGLLSTGLVRGSACRSGGCVDLQPISGWPSMAVFDFFLTGNYYISCKSRYM